MTELRIGSLCTGYGGLDMAVQEVLGGELAWVADNDPGAAAILAHRFPKVPNLGDITETDWSQVEPVDILAAGFPCQDISNAGQRAGLLEGNRSGLFFNIADAVRVLRPRLVVLENVAAIRTRGLDTVLAELASLGFDAEWTCVRADEIGAPNQRRRWFLAAQDPHRPVGGEWRFSAPGQEEGGRARPDARGRGGAPAPDAPVQRLEEGREGLPGTGDSPANATCDGRDERWSEPAGEPGRSGTPGGRSQTYDWRERPEYFPWSYGIEWGPYEPAIRRWEQVLGRPAPAPKEPAPRGGERLAPAFAEWMLGIPLGHVTAVPGLGRNAQLRAIGNGVCPQQGAHALRELLPLLTSSTT